MRDARDLYHVGPLGLDNRGGPDRTSLVSRMVMDGSAAQIHLGEAPWAGGVLVESRIVWFTEVVVRKQEWLLALAERRA
jgi:hypothetical protein